MTVCRKLKYSRWRVRPRASSQTGGRKNQSVETELRMKHFVIDIIRAQLNITE